MAKRFAMVGLSLMLLVGIVVPASAKGTGVESRVVKESQQNLQAAMSKLEFATVLHHLLGYEIDNKVDTIGTAKSIGYWDVVFGTKDKGRSAITAGEALEILNYVFPKDSMQGLTAITAKPEKPLKKGDAVLLMQHHIQEVFRDAGTYKNQTIQGNVLINHSDVTIKNSTIHGDVFITNGTGITLQNVTVSGTVYVKEEIQNNVQTIDSSVKQVVVYKPGQQDSDWTLVWSDEFMSNTIDSSKWTYDIGNWIVDEKGTGISPGWGNNELQYYTDSPENSFIQNGKLVIKAKKEEVPVTDQFGSYQYTSAKLKTKGLFSKKYGKFEARIKSPQGKGYWPAFWMMPEKDVYGSWPTSGEIDIMEAAGKDPSRIGGTIHYGEQYPNNTYKGAEYHFPEGEAITDFHTYGVEWEPGEIRWYVDGKLYQTLNNWFSKGKDQASKYAFPAPFDQEFYMILNLAIGGWYGGNPDETTQFPGEMEVDYVRAYELTGREYKTPVEPVVEREELPEDAKLPLADGNYIYDQAYEKPITIVNDDENALDEQYWNFVYLPDFAGNGAIAKEKIDDKTFAKADITNAGNALWALQLIQKLSIVEGGTYKVSFDAKSNTNRNMMVKVSGGAERAYANYSGEQTIRLTDTVKPYEFTFTLNQETDIAARLEFNMGANGNAPVWIGNVRVEEVIPEDPANASKAPLGDGNHVYNGTFDQGDMTRTNFWELVKNPLSSAKMSVDEKTRELQVIGADSDASLLVKQTGIQLLKGNTYKLTFDARSTKNRAIEVELVGQDGVRSYTDAVVDLTNEMKSHSMEFTMTTEMSDKFSQLLFKLGGQGGDVYLDNIRLIRTSEYIDYDQVDLQPLKNGDFSAGMDAWGSYIHYDAAATFSAQNKELQVQIQHPGNEAWSILLEQGNIKLTKGVTYVLSFDARSTVARDIEVTVENAGYYRYLSQKVSLQNEMNSYRFEWIMGANDTGALKFLLGKTAEAHDITIDNVVLAVKRTGE
jgi:beta-glucanase (GH16 family)